MSKQTKKRLSFLLALVMMLSTLPFGAAIAAEEPPEELEALQWVGVNALQVPSLKEVYADHFMIGNILANTSTNWAGTNHAGTTAMFRHHTVLHENTFNRRRS